MSLEENAGHKLRKGDFVPLVGLLRRDNRRREDYYADDASFVDSMKVLKNYLPGTVAVLAYNASLGVAATGLYLILENL